jgi:predicted transcriptional regulator YdeE
MITEPTFATKPSFRIIGIERYTENGISSIREAWDELGARTNQIPNAVTPEISIGFEDYSRDLVMKPGEFPKYYYLASREVTDLTNIPSEMKGREVPEAHYAIFTYRGALNALADFFAQIYGEWMPKSNCKMDPKLSFDFERYPLPITDPSNILVEIHIPIVAK